MAIVGEEPAEPFVEDKAVAMAALAEATRPLDPTTPFVSSESARAATQTPAPAAAAAWRSRVDNSRRTSSVAALIVVLALLRAASCCLAPEPEATALPSTPARAPRRAATATADAPPSEAEQKQREAFDDARASRRTPSSIWRPPTRSACSTPPRPTPRSARTPRPS